MTFYKAQKVEARGTSIQIAAEGRRFEFTLLDHQTVIKRPNEEDVEVLIRVADRDGTTYNGGRILELQDLYHSMSFTFELPPGAWAELKPVVDDWYL